MIHFPYNILPLRFLRTICVAFIVSFLFFITSNCSTDNTPTHHIIIMHSFSVDTEFLHDVETEINQAYKDINLKVNIHHFWCNSTHETKPEIINRLNLFNKTLFNSKNKPELFIINDDPALDIFINADTLFTKAIPCVFAGINLFDKKLATEFPLMYGLTDNIDVIENIKLGQRFSQDKHVLIELDISEYDIKLRNFIEKKINNAPDTLNIINNFDHHYNMKVNEPTKEPSLNRSDIIVTPISIVEPEQNSNLNNDPQHGISQLESFFYHVRFRNVIYQVKHDVWGNGLLNHSEVPQFTMINEQFGDPIHTKFLCGYFTSRQSQTTEAARFAKDIIEEHKPHRFRTHTKSYMMDYNAMKMMNLAYDDYDSEFTIINAPWSVRHSNLYNIGLYGLAITFLTGIFIYSLIINQHKAEENNKLRNNLERELLRRNLALIGTNSFLFRLSQDKFRLYGEYLGHNSDTHEMTSYETISEEFYNTIVHPDSRQLIQDIFTTHYNSKEGERKRHRIRLSFNGGKSFQWWNLTYTINHQQLAEHLLIGLMVNAQEEYQTEIGLIKAREAAEGLRLRSNFLANISHDIRTPLGAIVGFAQLLSESRETLSEEEKKHFADIIENNTNTLLNLVEDVVDKARLQVGDVSLHPTFIHISKIINYSYESNKIQAPSHIKFIKDFPDNEDALIFVDKNRVNQVLNNLLSNAFKYTRHGSVTLGWRYHSQSNEIEVFVKDTGIGIAQDQIEIIFDRFKVVNDANHKSIGLGLSICKTIVTKLGGHIKVQSTLGLGSCFSIFFPRHNFDFNSQDIENETINTQDSESYRNSENNRKEELS